MAQNFNIDLAYLIGGWFEAVLWGVYSVLFSICMFCVWRKRRTDLFRTTTVVLVIMYLFATVHISLGLRRLIEAFIINRAEEDPQLYFANVTIHLNVAKDYFYILMMVLGDSIVVWRCFIVWNRNYWVVSLPVLMLISTAVGGLGSTSLDLFTIVPDTAASWGETVFITSLITNVSVTCLTAGRIWHQSRGSRQFFPHGHGGYGQVLLVVIESGLLIAVWKSIEFALWTFAPRDGLHGMNAIYIVYEAIVQIEGIVPTAIILAVTLGYTSQKTYALDTTPGISFRPRDEAETSGMASTSFASNAVHLTHDSNDVLEMKAYAGSDNDNVADVMV